MFSESQTWSQRGFLSNEAKSYTVSVQGGPGPAWLFVPCGWFLSPLTRPAVCRPSSPNAREWGLEHPRNYCEKVMPLLYPCSSFSLSLDCSDLPLVLWYQYELAYCNCVLYLNHFYLKEGNWWIFSSSSKYLLITYCVLVAPRGSGRESA